MTFDEHSLPGLYLLWPAQLLSQPPHVEVPHGYSLRTYREGEDRVVRDLLASDHWTISDAHWNDYKDRLLPKGLFLIIHTDTHVPVGTAGAVHNPRPGRYYFPFGGELGDLLVHPAHRRQGLGSTLAGAVVQRLLMAGYESIRVGVQGFRLPAIKTYLKVGFVPFLHQEGLASRWQRICDQIQWPYTPEAWPKTLHDNRPHV